MTRSLAGRCGAFVRRRGYIEAATRLHSDSGTCFNIIIVRRLAKSAQHRVSHIEQERCIDKDVDDTF